MLPTTQVSSACMAIPPWVGAVQRVLVTLKRNLIRSNQTNLLVSQENHPFKISATRLLMRDLFAVSKAFLII